MKTPCVLAVSGIKNSGKTRLLERLIPALTASGLRVAAIKHDGHCFAPDREGTDSARMLAAGATGAAVFDGEKLQIVKYASVTERELIACFPEVDLILLEGFKHSAYPKLEVWRPELSAAPVCETSTLLALVTDAKEGPPGVLRVSPDDVETLTALIQQQLHQNQDF